MKLTELESDALNELFNIGLHRAAASLSDLTGKRVLVELPRLWVCSMEELKDRLLEVVSGDLATVHQFFGGPMAGDAVLLLEYEKAVMLADLMTGGEVALGGRLDQSAREVITEIGNIVLSSCMGAFGNVLKVAVSFSVPRIHIESLEGMLRTVVIDSDQGIPYALVAATRFGLSELEISGYLIVVIGVKSLELVSQALTGRLNAP
jgi:chemotaxis protein CheC